MRAAAGKPACPRARLHTVTTATCLDALLLPLLLGPMEEPCLLPSQRVPCPLLPHLHFSKEHFCQHHHHDADPAAAGGPGGSHRGRHQLLQGRQQCGADRGASAPAVCAQNQGKAGWNCDSAASSAMHCRLQAAVHRRCIRYAVCVRVVVWCGVLCCAVLCIWHDSRHAAGWQAGALHCIAALMLQLRDLPEEWQCEIPNRGRLLREEQEQQQGEE